MHKTTILLFLLLFAETKIISQTSGKWGYQGDGTYNNPILPGDYSDLDAIYLKSCWGINGNSQYSFSTDGSIFEPFGKPYKMTWGNYRGDRISIFCYNSTEEKGYVDVDWFHYDYRTR